MNPRWVLHILYIVCDLILLRLPPPHRSLYDTHRLRNSGAALDLGCVTIGKVSVEFCYIQTYSVAVVQPVFAWFMSVNYREWSVGSLIAYCPTRNVSSLSPNFTGRKKKMCCVSTHLLCWEKSAPYPLCGAHSNVRSHFKSQPVHELSFLFDQWGAWGSWSDTFADSCKHWVVPWWLKFGNSVSGRKKAALGSSHFGGKRKQNRRVSESEPGSLESSQTLEWTIPPPSLSKLPYFSPSLSHRQHFFTTFLPNPSISLGVFCALFPVPSFFFFLLLFPYNLPQLIWVRTCS